MDLQVELRYQNNVLIARLKGELDHHHADQMRCKLENEILRHQHLHIVLNLKKLTFMDSSGIGVILGRYKLLHHRGGSMVLCDVPAHVKRILELSGIGKILAFYDNEAQAIASLEVLA